MHMNQPGTDWSTADAIRNQDRFLDRKNGKPPYEAKNPVGSVNPETPIDTIFIVMERAHLRFEGQHIALAAGDTFRLRDYGSVMINGWIEGYGLKLDNLTLTRQQRDGAEEQTPPVVDDGYRTFSLPRDMPLEGLEALGYAWDSESGAFVKADAPNWTAEELKGIKDPAVCTAPGCGMPMERLTRGDKLRLAHSTECRKVIREANKAAKDEE